MNNLTLMLLAFGTTGALFLGGQTLQARSRAENAILSRRLNELADAKRDLLERLALLQQERDKTNDMARQAEGMLATSLKPNVPPFEPEREGIWPTNKSYFYLSKEALRHAFFQQFEASPDGLRSTSQCAVMLGLSPEEASVLDRKFEDLVVEFRQREFDSLQRWPTHASDRYTGQKVSYRIPPLRDAMAGPLQIFQHEVTSMLGETRAEAFQYWMGLCIAESLADFGRTGRIFTFTEDPPSRTPRLTRFEIADDDGKNLYYFEIWTPSAERFPPGFPQHLRPRFHWRHLFGENAERRANPWAK